MTAQKRSKPHKQKIEAVAVRSEDDSDKEAARPGFVARTRRWIANHKVETVLIVLLLVISTTAHAWNMYGYPYYENDEATYTSRGWMVVNQGQLDVYTYRYDHAPLGWMLIGAWQLITGGANLFGSLLESGRAFMLLIHIASTILLYIVARRFSGGSKLAATVAVLFFALSPIALYFQRRILLDNIMTFWLLLSLYFATQPVQRLKYYILSALTFGIAVLTKLNIVFVAPAILYIVWARAHKQHRMHAVAYWISLAGIVIVSFFLFALLKGELFAAPTGPDGLPLHVSVVETFKLQLGRGEFAWPWLMESSFMQNVKSWALKDWAVLALGAASTLFITVVGVHRRKTQPYILAAAGLVLLYMAFLARGKLVLDLYVVPLIPLLALAIGLVVGIIYNDWLRDRRLRDVFLVVSLGGIIGLYAIAATNAPYTTNETSNQVAAAEWVKQHVPKDAIIATDNYLYPYLAQEDHYKHVSYFFSTEYDPQLRKLYDNDWRNVEYLVLTHEIVKQIKSGTVPRMKQVLDHAVLQADFRKDASSYIDLPNYISTNGDWAQVYKIKDRNAIVLQDSWHYFKDNFIVDYGQVIDPGNNSLTTSTGQAQAMLRAVEQGDKATFSGVWGWSKDHLRYRQFDKLLSWRWDKQPEGSYKLGDSNTVCDADQLVAYALYMAEDKWPGRGYGEEAKVQASDWWRQCTFEMDGKRYIDSSADGSKTDRLINPGYFRPALYRYLATKQPDLSWQKLIDDGYELNSRIYASQGTVPNWIIMSANGALSSASTRLGIVTDAYGFDAMQLVFSFTQDYASSKDQRALDALGQLEPRTAQLATVANNVSAHATLLLNRQALYSGTSSSQELQKQYEQTVFSAYHSKDGHWADGKSFHDQVWLWQWHTYQGMLGKNQQIRLR